MDDKKAVNENATEEEEKIRLQKLKKEIEQRAAEELSHYNSQSYRINPNPYGIVVEQNPREYLHNFLLQAKHAGCNVDHYIDEEIKRMLNELIR